MYFVGKDGQQTGPFSVDQLKDMATSGGLLPGDLVWKDGMPEWKPASSIPGIFTESPASAGSMPTVTPDAVLPPGTPLPMFGGAMPMSGPRNNGLAVAGLVLGILSMTLGLCCCYGLPFSVPGIICSVLGMNQIKADPMNQTGRPLAMTGLGLSIASMVIACLMVVLGVALNWEQIMKSTNQD